MSLIGTKNKRPMKYDPQDINRYEPDKDMQRLHFSSNSQSRQQPIESGNIVNQSIKDNYDYQNTRSFSLMKIYPA